MPVLSNLSFEAWLDHAFAPPVRPGLPQWYFEPDAPWWNPAPAVAVDYLTRLFSSPVSTLADFSDAQIAQGLTYLVNTSATGDDGWLYSRDVPAVARLACIDSVATLFAELFAPRCAPVLGHCDEPGASELNMVCYMWWEGFPCVALPDDPDRDRLQLATIEGMARILALDSIACQESALHGLGHLARHYPQAVEGAIERFLADPSPKKPELVAYAHSARCGCVL